VLACRDVNPKMPIVRPSHDRRGRKLPRRGRPRGVRRPPGGMECGCARINCSVGPSHARRHRAGAGRDFPAPGRATECRHAALGRRTKHLSLFAGIYASYTRKFVPPGATHRRLLWHHARPYSRHEVGLRVREARGKTAISEAIHTGVAPSAPPAFRSQSARVWAQELRLGNL